MSKESHALLRPAIPLFPDQTDPQSGTSTSTVQKPWKSSPPEKESVLVSPCFLGVPCRWHGRRAKRRDTLLAKLKEKYVIIPVCPEQLGGMPTPRTRETHQDGTGALVLDEGGRLIAPETVEDVTEHHIKGSYITLEIAQQVGARRAYLKSCSPSCNRDDVTGEVLRRGGIQVIRAEQEEWRSTHTLQPSPRSLLQPPPSKQSVALKLRNVYNQLYPNNI